MTSTNHLKVLLNDALIGTEQVQQCALIGRKDKEVKALSVGFKLTNDDVHLLLDTFNNLLQLRDDGLTFHNKQYYCIRADRNSIYAKYESTGVILVKTGSFVLVATYGENMSPSICIEAVEKLGDYLKDKGK